MTAEAPVEVELKYRVSDETAGERLLTADELGPFRAVAGVKSSRSEDHYVDTADGAVAHAGFAARLRTERGTTVVHLKALASADGDGALQRRTELEGPTDGTGVPKDWPELPARSLLLEVAGDAPLSDVAVLRQRRRKRKFAADDTIVELSFDEVDVLAAGERVERFRELEVELVSGPEGPLVALAPTLDADDALAPSRTSKFEAALAAIRRTAGDRDAKEAAEKSGAGDTAAEAPVIDEAQRRHNEAVRANAEVVAALTVGRTAGVTADDVVAEAGRKVLRFHLARMVAREAGTRLGEDPEELHSMRVATRRMRAAWRVFGDGFRPAPTKRFRDRLRDVARKLGVVRDIDVLVIALEDYRKSLPEAEQRGLDPLIADWRAQREAGRVVLMRELDSGRYRRFVESYVTFALTPSAGSLVVSPTDPHHVRDTQGSRIWTAYEAVLAYGPVLRWADVPTLHQLRIAGKWLRYTLEFVSEPMGADAKPLIEKVVAMQDHLGLMNDAEVAAIKARSLLVAGAGTLSDAETAAIARYLASREKEVARLKRTAATTWRVLASPTFRRGLGRAVAALARPGTVPLN